MGYQGGRGRDEPGSLLALAIVFAILIAGLVGIYIGVKTEPQPAPVFHQVDLMEGGKPVRTWRARGYVRNVDAGLFQADTMARFIDDDTGQEVVAPLQKLVVARIQPPTSAKE